ncbi:MAG: RNA polymerase sigma factor [Sphingobacteriales bacterium]|nr:RNA polymerase sigma factor [Sphingobacteriales bacterium]
MQPNDDKVILYNELIESCKSNNRDAQYKLYSLLSGKMFAVCLRYAKNREAAADLLQEGFVKVFVNIDKFRGDGSFEGWVLRIIVNTAVEHYRKSTKMYPVVNVDDINKDIPWADTGDELELEDLMKMIDKLSHGYKTVFNLYVVEGFSHKEIGELLEISEGTSKSQLARARYLLVDMVKKSEIVKKSATIAK